VLERIKSSAKTDAPRRILCRISNIVQAAYIFYIPAVAQTTHSGCPNAQHRHKKSGCAFTAAFYHI
jgi:hypothetical protein